MSADIRWKQRFDNFSRAYILLSTAFEGRNIEDFDELQKEGLIQRFQYTFELTWKTLKDYLEYETVPIDVISPRNVIKEAADSNLLELMGVDGEILFDMLQTRNLLSHTYDFTFFESALEKIENNYLSEIAGIYAFLKEK